MTEPLSARISKLREEAIKASAERERAAYQSNATKAARDFAAATWFITSFLIGISWVWQNVIWPVWKQLAKPLRWLIRKYVALWNHVVIIKDPYGKPAFSKTRAGFMVLGTAIFYWYLMEPIFGLGADTVLYVLTGHRDEQVILLASQEIDPLNNTHQIEGCWQFPCSDTDSFYFRVRSSPFNHIWNFTHFKGPFLPDYVAAAVPTVPSHCVITSYGLRWNFVIRNFNVFPEVLEVKSCNVIHS